MPLCHAFGYDVTGVFGEIRILTVKNSKKGDFKLVFTVIICVGRLIPVTWLIKVLKDDLMLVLRPDFRCKPTVLASFRFKECREFRNDDTGHA